MIKNIVVVLLAVCLLYSAVSSIRHEADLVDEVLSELFTDLLLEDKEGDVESEEANAGLSDSENNVQCTNTPNSGLNVRNSAGNIVNSLPHNTRVQVSGPERTMLNEAFVPIGADRFVAKRFLQACATPAPTPAPSGGNKYEETLKLIFGHEGQCQNWNNDVGNHFQGKLGYTCMGITPGVGFNNRNVFPYALPYNGHPADFVKFAYDRDRNKFYQGAAQIYRQNYFYPCDHLPQPAFYVCADISVNSGPGRSQDFLRQLGAYNGDAKGYARDMNELHRQFYLRIGAPGTANNQFLRGWLNRADSRDRFINNY